MISQKMIENNGIAKSNVHLCFVGTRSPGTVLFVQKRHRRAMEVTWKNLDVERDYFLRIAAIREKSERSRKETRYLRMANLESHLKATEIDEIERAEWRHRKRRPTTSAFSCRRERDDVASPLEDMNKIVGHNRPTGLRFEGARQTDSIHGIRRTSSHSGTGSAPCRNQSVSGNEMTSLPVRDRVNPHPTPGSGEKVSSRLEHCDNRLIRSSSSSHKRSCD